MDHERERHDLARRQVHALEHLARESCAIQDTLELIAKHLLGGMSPEEVKKLKAEAETQKLKLMNSRMNLSAAIEAAKQKDPTQ